MPVPPSPCALPNYTPRLATSCLALPSSRHGKAGAEHRIEVGGFELGSIQKISADSATRSRTTNSCFFPPPASRDLKTDRREICATQRKLPVLWLQIRSVPIRRPWRQRWADDPAVLSAGARAGRKCRARPRKVWHAFAAAEKGRVDLLSNRESLGRPSFVGTFEDRIHSSISRHWGAMMPPRLPRKSISDPLTFATIATVSFSPAAATA